MEQGMVDPGYPNNQPLPTTTTTTTSIYFDKSYLHIRNIPAVLKGAIMLCNLVGYFCSSFSEFSHSSWFCFVSMTGFWITAVLLILYVMHVIEKFQKIPWIKIELGYSVLWMVLFLIAASCSIYRGGADSAAGFFGYISMILYGVEAFFKFKAFRTGDVAQGQKQMQAASELGSPGAY